MVPSRCSWWDRTLLLPYMGNNGSTVVHYGIIPTSSFYCWLRPARSSTLIEHEGNITTKDSLKFSSFWPRR